MNLPKLGACLLILGMSACAHNPERVPSVKVVPVPAELVEPIPAPELQGDTNAALVAWIEGWKAALKRANDRLRSIGQLGE